MRFMNRMMVAALAAAALTACSDTTSPGKFDPAAMDTQMQNLTGTFSGNAVFQSLLALGPALPSFSATHLLRASTRQLIALKSPLAQRSRIGMANLVVPRAPGGTLALFPANVLGKTFVWDTALGEYKMDSTIAGAPVTGVRIRLYVVSQGTGQPVVPLQFLGYLDLTDISTVQANAVRVVLKFGGTTVADYSITNPVGTNFNEMVLAGFITASDGSGQITFSFDSYTHTNTGAEDDIFTVSNATASLRLESHNDSLGNGTTLFRAQTSGNTLELTGTYTGGVDAGQVKFNGVVFATYTDVTGDMVFTGADGHPLSSTDQAHLGALFAGFLEVVVILFFGLLGPAFVVSAFIGA